MSGTSSTIAARLESVFGRVKAQDFAGAASAVKDYERETRNVMSVNFSSSRANNELHVDLLKVLQQLKDLDFAKLKLSNAKLAQMKDLVVSMSDQVASLRKEGTLANSAHLEVHLMFILRSLDPIFNAQAKIVAEFHDYVRLRMRLRFATETDVVMGKLEAYIDHIFSLTYNRGLKEFKTAPQGLTWANASAIALKIGVYSKSHLEQVSDRVYARFNAFKTSPLLKKSPEVGHSFYTATIDEMISLAEFLPVLDDLSVSSPTRQFKLLQYLTAFSLSLQYLVECKSSNLDVDVDRLRGALAHLRQALAAFSSDETDSTLLDDCFVAAFWALDESDLSALPELRFRVTSSQRLGEIQFYAFQLVPQSLAAKAEQGTTASSPSLQTPQMTSILSASWNSCFIACKPTDQRLLRDVTRALEDHLKGNIFLNEDYPTGLSIDGHLSEIDVWRTRNELTGESVSLSYLDGVGVLLQRYANNLYIAGNFDKSIPYYVKACRVYVRRHEGAAPPPAFVQESRLWPCHEFLARAYEMCRRWECCVDSLARGLRLLTDERVFKMAFEKALTICSKLSNWNVGSLCEKLFALVDSAPSSSTWISTTHSLPMDRLVMMTTELNRWRSTKWNTIDHQTALLGAMKASPDLTPDQETWIAVEKISTDYAAAGAINTEEKYNELITQLNRIVHDSKKVSNPSPYLRFFLAKAYFLLHVLTTSKLADCIQEKQKAQDAANKSPSTLPSAENPEGDENLGSDLDTCTNFVTVSLQKRTYENLEKSFQILSQGDFEPDSDHLRYDYLNLVSVMAAYWDLGSFPDRTLSTYLLGLRFARAAKLEDAAASYAGKAALYCCRYEMYDVAGSFLRDAERFQSKRSLEVCQYFQLARAWHAFGIRDHAVSENVVKTLLAKPRTLERSVLVELMILRSAQLLMAAQSSPYLRGAESWESPQALLQFGMRLAESVSGQMGKNGAAGGFKEISYVEFVVLVLRVFSAYCNVCDSCEWVRESGFLFKESFQIAERYGVPHWMADIMLQRVGRDVLINAKNEAETRLREVKFILNSPGDSFLAHLKLTGVLARKCLFHDASSGDDDDDESFALPKVPQVTHHRYHRGVNNSDEDSSPTRLAQKTASPLFKRTASTAPTFVTHESTCACSMCDDLVYQKCLLDLMLQHGALLLKQDAPAQTVIAADAGLKIHDKLVETWRKKRSQWRTMTSNAEDRNVVDDDDDDEGEPFLERFWNLKILKAEALLSLGRVGQCQAALKPMVDGVDAAHCVAFSSSKWSKLTTTSLGSAHYLYVVSLGDSLSASEKMMSADWLVLQRPAKTETVTNSELPGDFDAMLNLGITCRKPSTTSRSCDSENIPPKKGRVKSEAITLTPNALPNLTTTPSTLKEAQNNKPAFFVYADNDAGDVFDHKPVIKSEGAVNTDKAVPSVGQAPKKRAPAKSRTARVNLQEPDALPGSDVAKKSATTPPKSVKKPPILSAESFTKAAVASRTPKPSPAASISVATPSVAAATPSAADAPLTSKARSSARRKKNVPAIAFEIPSSPEASPTEDNSDGVGGKSNDARHEVSSRNLRPASKMESFVSSPEASPDNYAPSRRRAPGCPSAKKNDEASKEAMEVESTPVVKKVSPRRKWEESNVDSAAEGTSSSKRKCGGRRKAAETLDVDVVPSLDDVTKDIGALNLTNAKARKTTYTKSATAAASSSSSSSSTRAGTLRKKRAALDAAEPLVAPVVDEVARFDENDDGEGALNSSVISANPLSPLPTSTSSPSSSSSATTSADESGRDRYSTDDNVFTPGPQLDQAAAAMNAEVIRKDSPNGHHRPKVKLLAGDAIVASAGDAEDPGLIVEQFTIKRATGLIEKAIDLMSPFPMGYVYRQCAERLILLKGCEDAVACSGVAVQSTGLAFRHSCLLNACKFIIREKFGYAEKTPALFHTTSEWLSFKNTPQDVVSRVLEHLPPTWKVAQLRVVDATPNLLSTISKPSASSLLLVTLFTANSLASNILLPFNSRILDQYAAQLTANLDSIKKGHDNLISYWEKREAEDKNMGRFLMTTEQDLLGPWVGLLMGGAAAKKLADAAVEWNKLIEKALALLPEVSQALVDASDGSLPNVLMEAYLKGFFKLSPALRCDGVQQLVGKSMPILEAHEIVRRIEKLLNQTTSKGVKVKSVLENLEPVVVVLDGHLQSLPVERFPSFEVNSSMTRLPSALFFPVVVKHSAIHHRGGVDADKGWYLIDPASNLEGTRERMKSWVEVAFSQWNGVIGKEPDAVHALKQVRTQDVYMYCGHGSGAIFIGRDDVQRDLLRAVCFLIGCSAGLLSSLGGNMEPWGRVIPFIIGCAPAIVSPLWEVTDRDIDIFTQDMLDYWLKATKPSARISLAKVMDKAAEKLKCKFANGRSCVTYGIPIYRKK